MFARGLQDAFKTYHSRKVHLGNTSSTSFEPGPATVLTKRFWCRCFAVNFVKFLRTPFYMEHLCGCLWIKASLKIYFTNLTFCSTFRWLLTKLLEREFLEKVKKNSTTGADLSVLYFNQNFRGKFWMTKQH